MKLGVVFEGGGGKGAYQIGFWKALRELNIEQYVTCVSGTSVGALNAALFYKGDLALAERIWTSISDDDILYLKNYDDYNNGDCFFSQVKLREIIESAIRGPSHSKTCKEVYVTCRYRDKGAYRYFKWSDFYDPELKTKVLLASAAIPVVFESVMIDGDYYVDGGANGDNTPVAPLNNTGLDRIIVVHLSGRAPDVQHDGRIKEIFPSQDLGGFVSGVLDFDPDSARRRIELGYNDAMNALTGIADKCLKIPDLTPACADDIKNNDNSITENKFTEVLEMIDFTFTNEEAQREFEGKLEALKKVSENIEIDSKYVWDKTVEKYASKMRRVQKILDSEGIREQLTAKMKKDISNFLTLCSDRDFEIAMVGTVKAGKSTLINALLGFEYAPTEVTPETAALTKFRKGAENCVKVSFYTPKQWDEIVKNAQKTNAKTFLEKYKSLGADKEKNDWLGKDTITQTCATKEELAAEIQKWVSSKSGRHYFVSEVSVELADFPLPDDVVFVDTPGFDDPNKYRSDITCKYVEKANAVLICVEAHVLTGSEVETINGVFTNRAYESDAVYIVGTQTDKLNDPVEDWKKQRDDWIKHLECKGAYADPEKAAEHTIPTTAYMYSLLNQYNSGTLTTGDKKHRLLSRMVPGFGYEMSDIDDNYQTLINYTGIGNLQGKIKDMTDKRNEIRIKHITGKYEVCKDSIKEALAKIKQTHEDIINTTQGGIEEIKKRQAECEAEYESTIKDEEALNELLSDIKAQASQKADELVEKIKSYAN